MPAAVGHRCRRLLRRIVSAYHLQCAREDARRLGVLVPDGVWSCHPCRSVFLAGADYLVHAAHA